MVRTGSRSPSPAFALITAGFAGRIDALRGALNYLHYRAGNDRQVSRQHHVLAGNQSVCHHHIAALSLPQRDDPQFGGLVRFYDVNERTLLADLGRLAGNHHRTLIGGQDKPDVHELSGPEMVIRIWNRRPQVDSPSRILYGIVEERHLARTDTFIAVGRKSDARI